MSKSKARVRLCVRDGDVKMHIDRIDRSTRIYQRLTHDGEWQVVGDYERRLNSASTISRGRAMEILTQLTGESA